MKKYNVEFDKTTVCTCITDVCKANGWSAEENVKTEKWKADVVVEYGNYKVAFNVCKSPRKVEETYQAMRKERVCGCWLLLPSKNSTFLDSTLPCFYLIEADDIQVCFEPPYRNETSPIALSDFVKSIVEGRIKLADKMKVHYADVCFIENTCCKCGAKSHIYFISRLYSDEGIETTESGLAFNTYVIRAIQTHIASHPELGIRLGAIKPRYSKTVNDTYMSFGCCKCDSIFGDFFVQDAIMDCYYDTDKLPKIRIDLSEANIEIPVRCWYQKK